MENSSQALDHGKRQWVEGARHHLPPDVAAGLRADQLRLGLSLRRAERRTGVSFGYLYLLEQGPREPSREMAIALIDGLKLDAELAARLWEEARLDAGRS